jgi:hypothetical protein
MPCALRTNVTHSSGKFSAVGYGEQRRFGPLKSFQFGPSFTLKEPHRSYGGVYAERIDPEGNGLDIHPNMKSGGGKKPPCGGYK